MMNPETFDEQLLQHGVETANVVGVGMSVYDKVDGMRFVVSGNVVD